MAVPEENRRQPKKPSIAIFVHAGETEPTVFSTAMSNQEQDQLYAWIEKNPGLEELVQRAQLLANDFFLTKNPNETSDTTFDATQEVRDGQ